MQLCHGNGTCGGNLSVGGDERVEYNGFAVKRERLRDGAYEKQGRVSPPIACWVMRGSEEAPYGVHHSELFVCADVVAGEECVRIVGVPPVYVVDKVSPGLVYEYAGM